MSDSSSHGRLALALRQEVEALPPGERIPTHRELVRRFGVSASTVADALALLVAQGLIESRPGAGSFRTEARPTVAVGDTSWQETALEITEQSVELRGIRRRFDAPGLLTTLTPANGDVIDLNGGYLHHDLQPLPLLTSALSRVARRNEAWDRPAPGGVPELRDWFAADIGGGLGRQDVLLCGGGQGALATTLRALGQPGDPVIVESPSYPGTAAAARAAALRPVAVALDAHGMRVDYLDEALSRTKARIVVLQPLFQNPTGLSLTTERGRDICQVARRHGAFVVEDDYARRLAHDDSGALPAPLICDDPDGVVIHIRSMTKATSANLRVSAVAARGPVMSRLRAASVIDTMLVPAALQYTTLEVVTSTGWRRALTQLGKALRHRRDVAADAVLATFSGAALPYRPRGGYHLWISLPAQADSSQFAADALTYGVAVTPGHHYFVNDEGKPHVRISYIAAPSPADVADGIRRLAPLVAGPDARQRG
jgi:DNA-binding transcriptional MocR family regulator